ncbi:endolytic transglycosylase MltG [Teredinibacter haidensis]|uniref:endolytic transglycosylase MltG n=1 Tax=Teredinibacter haidensis TaxID=2731755 RepID=UPI000948CD56|nr:endolytic transglycosylase MltG [Teredinibacter haidensis]
MNVSLVRVVLALTLWVLLMMGASIYYVWSWLHTPQRVELVDKVYVIEHGSSLHRVASDLNEKGMIRWPRIWVTYARLLNLSNIKAGEYKLAQKESPVSLLSRFQTGELLQYQITLVEGRNLKEFIESLHSHKKIVQSLAGMSNVEIAKALEITAENPEGYFFPDTYQFVSGDSDKDILLRAHLKMTQLLHEEWLNRAGGLPYKTAYEALIMASIVEKETGAAFERKQIAGVFVRRLQSNMRLQTDPTVIYGMGENYTGNIRKSDLKKPTPYNTYTNRGLPPTPIAMPGKESIRAALHPASGSTLFFVAKGDGTHYFSSTLKEHEEAVKKYQKKRRSDYRSAPEPAVMKQKEGVVVGPDFNEDSDAAR